MLIELELDDKLGNKYPDASWYNYMYDSMFKDPRYVITTGNNRPNDRIYIPYKIDDSAVYTTTANDIIHFLNNQKLTDIDYINGYAKKDKQTIKIGKYLQSSASENWLSERLYDYYSTDIIRDIIKGHNGELYLCISRYKDDVVLMSSGRKWSSCMNIGYDYDEQNKKWVKGTAGKYCKSVKEDITAGTLICYIITKDDLNIDKPLARVLIKPYIRSESFNNEIKYLKVSSRFYGLFSSDNLPDDSIRKDITDKLNQFLNETYNKNKLGKFNINKKLYNDQDVESIFVEPKTYDYTDPKNMTIWLEKYNTSKYGATIENLSGIITINGDVEIHSKNFNKLPFHTNRAYGSITIINNEILNTLEGFPSDSVKSMELGHLPELKSLKGCPKIIEDKLTIYDTGINDLSIMPTKVREIEIWMSNESISSEELSKLNKTQIEVLKLIAPFSWKYQDYKETINRFLEVTKKLKKYPNIGTVRVLYK